MKVLERLDRLAATVDRSEERLRQHISAQATVQRGLENFLSAQAQQSVLAASAEQVEGLAAVSKIIVQRLGAMEALLSASYSETMQLGTQNVALADLVSKINTEGSAASVEPAPLAKLGADKAALKDLLSEALRESKPCASETEPQAKLGADKMALKDLVSEVLRESSSIGPERPLGKAGVTHEVGLQTEAEGGAGGPAEALPARIHFHPALGGEPGDAAPSAHQGPAHARQQGTADAEAFAEGLAAKLEGLRGEQARCEVGGAGPERGPEDAASRAIELYAEGCHRERERELQKAQARLAGRDDCVSRVGRSAAWRAACIALVLLNAAVVVAETEMNLNAALDTQLCIEGLGPPPTGSGASLALLLAEWAFLLWMSVELAVNVWTGGGFFHGEVGWNVFDAVVLAVSLVQLTVSQMDMSILRVVRLGRLLKVARAMRIIKSVRIVRFFRFLQGIRKMARFMVGSLVSLFWALFMLFFIVFLLAVVMAQGVETHYDSLVSDQDVPRRYPSCMADAPYNASTHAETSAGGDALPRFVVAHSDSLVQQVKKLYGGVGPTMMTLFGSVSGGSEWAVVASPVEQLSPAFTVAWMFFICLMVFGVLNVITGVFVDAVGQSARRDRDAAHQKEMLEQESVMNLLRTELDHCNQDGSARLSEAEFLALLEDAEIRGLLAHLGLHAGEAGGLFKLLQDEGTGSLTVNEFISGCVRLKGGAKEVGVITAMYQNKRLAKALSALQESVDAVEGRLRLLGEAPTNGKLVHFADEVPPQPGRSARGGPCGAGGVLSRALEEPVRPV